MTNWETCVQFHGHAPRGVAGAAKAAGRARRGAGAGLGTSERPPAGPESRVRLERIVRPVSAAL